MQNQSCKNAGTASLFCLLPATLSESRCNFPHISAKSVVFWLYFEPVNGAFMCAYVRKPSFKENGVSALAYL